MWFDWRAYAHSDWPWPSKRERTRSHPYARIRLRSWFLRVDHTFPDHIQFKCDEATLTWWNMLHDIDLHVFRSGFDIQLLSLGIQAIQSVQVQSQTSGLNALPFAAWNLLKVRWMHWSSWSSLMRGGHGCMIASCTGNWTVHASACFYMLRGV